MLLLCIDAKNVKMNKIIIRIVFLKFIAESTKTTTKGQERKGTGQGRTTKKEDNKKKERNI